MKALALLILAIGVAGIGAFAWAASPAEAPKALPATVRLGVTTRPNVGARVHFGRKMLGTAPLKFRRKRNSGPVDLVIRAAGYVPVNTRLYTSKDKVITVQLTRLDSQSKLYGYKEKLPPDAGLDPEEDSPSDGGVAAPVPTPDLVPTLAPTPSPLPIPAPPAAP